MISLVCVTNRPGGLDVLEAGLLRQSDKNFELVLVDALHPYRGHMKFDPSLSVKWLDGNASPDFQSNYMSAQNTGIEHASGETVLFICDYSFAGPDFVATHAAAQRERPGPFTTDYDYVGLAPVKPGLPHYRETIPGTRENADEYSRQTNEIARRFRADLDSGALNGHLWSIFETPFTADSLAALPVEHRHRPSGADLSNDWNHGSLKGESVPTELLLEMNGLDEEYNASHGWQDQEFSYRLRARGIPWRGGKPGEGMLTVVNPRERLNIKTLSKPLFHNQELCFNSRRAELGLPVNPGFSLRKRRNHTLGFPGPKEYTGHGCQPFPGAPVGTTYEFHDFRIP
jgi:hypothetical protein